MEDKKSFKSLLPLIAEVMMTLVSVLILWETLITANSKLDEFLHEFGIYSITLLPGLSFGIAIEQLIFEWNKDHPGKFYSANFAVVFLDLVLLYISIRMFPNGWLRLLIVIILFIICATVSFIVTRKITATD